VGEAQPTFVVDVAAASAVAPVGPEQQLEQRRDVEHPVGRAVEDPGLA
jgi:hypothetical protein